MIESIKERFDWPFDEKFEMPLALPILGYSIAAITKTRPTPVIVSHEITFEHWVDIIICDEHDIKRAQTIKQKVQTVHWHQERTIFLRKVA